MKKHVKRLIKHIKHPCAWAGIGVVLHSFDTIAIVGWSWASLGTIISGILAATLPNDSDIIE